jgi:peptide chain release factor 2
MSQEAAGLKEEVKGLEKLRKEVRDAQELAELSEGEGLEPELERIEKQLRKEEMKAFLAKRYDAGNAVLTVTAGAGGQDAQDWATILLRMYERYCEKKGWRSRVLSQSFGDPGPEGRIGTKQASLEIQGRYAYGFLKRENGIHRLVRISPFSAKSLRHTSFASVEVIPEIDTTIEKIEVRPDDLQIDTAKSSGPGGQNVNKRETAIRITHLPTGTITSSQAERSQAQNKERAMQMLLSKLYQLEEAKKEEEMRKAKGVQKAIEWGSQIRSYVLQPYTMVKDLRTGVETSQASQVLDGDLEQFIEAEIRLND